jgi:hypothetical protein
MGAGNAAGARKVPDGILVEALPDGAKSPAASAV